MIRSFRCEDTKKLFQLERVKRFQAIERQAQRKLAMLNAARELRDLSANPGNKLEKLSGDRKGQYSICINDQWRVCFVWADGDAFEVEVVDYH